MIPAANGKQPTYSALIRTRNSAVTLPQTLESIRTQTIQPAEYVIVDSGSTDKTLAGLSDNSLVHHFVGDSFNYSEALNQGLTHVCSDYVLVISSHTSLVNTHAIAFAMRTLTGNDDIGAAYFSYTSDEPLRFDKIDATSFDGFNGLSNTCALIRMDLLRRRPFRPEVFAAEDQEWASWLFYEEGKHVIRVSGADPRNINPARNSVVKWFKEYVAVALYANRRLLSLQNVARLTLDVVRPSRPLLLRRRCLLLALALTLPLLRLIGWTRRKAAQARIPAS